MGKGYALRFGINQADSDYYIITDIDLPYTASSMLEILKRIHLDGAIAAIGVRSKEYYSKIPVARKLISIVLRTFNKVALRLIISDTQCGLKAFNKIGKDIFMQTTVERFLFDVEFIKLLGRHASKSTLKQKVVLREGIELSSIGLSSLLHELKDYLRLVVT